MNVHTAARHFQDLVNFKGIFRRFMINQDHSNVKLNLVRKLLSERTIFRDTSPLGMRHLEIDCNTAAHIKHHLMDAL